MVDAEGFRPNVGIILANPAGRVLWAKRIGMDAWQFPQGGVNPGETPELALYRELREEIGLDAEPVDLARTYVYDDVEVHAFLVDVPDGWEPTLNDEHDEYRWCSPPDAAARLHWPETRELVSEL